MNVNLCIVNWYYRSKVRNVEKSAVKLRKMWQSKLSRTEITERDGAINTEKVLCEMYNAYTS
ncbi:hypothetical protein JPSP40_08450 [Staphylococcus pseudintermedius]